MILTANGERRWYLMTFTHGLFAGLALGCWLGMFVAAIIIDAKGEGRW